MRHRRTVDNLAKLLHYILGRQPDEFGLVPDADGYIRVKDLLKALSEEAGWRHVRLNHLREVIHAARPAPIEMERNRIRAVDRSRLAAPERSDTAPTLVYVPIRQRTYPSIHENGVPPDASGKRLVAAVDLEMAGRLGRRIDADPVILTVHTDHAREHGAALWRYGDRLCLLDRLPTGAFSGPPLPKQRPAPPPGPSVDLPATPRTPGSYLLDPSAFGMPPERVKHGARRRKNEWKRERKRRNR